MSMEAMILSALDGLVGGRVYADLAPEGAARPYIVYQQVGGDSVNFVDTTVPTKRNARVQVAVWADTRSLASSVSAQAEDALRVAAALQTTVLGQPVATYDAATKLRGALQDFSLWN